MKTIIIILALGFSNFGWAQNTYLKISEENKMSVSYPPGTKFKLEDSRGNLILKENDTPFKLEVDQPYTLKVFPTYKKEIDVYYVTNGKIELVSNLEYMNSIKHKKGAYQSYGVSLDNTVYTNSKVLQDETNVYLEFSNGATFSYKDGNVSATLNGKEVEVKRQYMIYSEAGIVKISYNPKTKELWWTFEPKGK